MSAEHERSKQYPVDAIHYYPKDKRLVIEVEGGVTFALTQNPDGLVAQLLLNQAASQRASVLQDDVVPAAESPQVLMDAATPTPEPASAPSPTLVPTSEALTPTDSLQPETPATPSKKADNQFLLSGRLKSKPTEGRPDGKGVPTAWARFAAHLDGDEEAWMLSTSFLRATRKVALSLNIGDQITVEGYINKNPDPEKMDRYNVFRFLNFPNKPPRLQDQS
jgi:hypothetical protein